MGYSTDISLKTIEKHINSLTKKDDVDYLPTHSEPLLHILVKHSNQKRAITLFDELLSLGANVEILNSLYQNVAHSAVIQKNVEMLKRLIEKGIDLEKLDFQLRRPIHYACQKANVETLKLLIQANVDLNCFGYESPLIFALDARHSDGNAFECAKLLIDNQVEYLSRVDEYGCNALLTYEAVHNKEVRDYFIEKGMNIFHETLDKQNLLHYCADFGDIEAFKFYCKKGLNPYAMSEMGHDAFAFIDDIQLHDELEQWYLALKESQYLDTYLTPIIQKQKQRQKI